MSIRNIVDGTFTVSGSSEPTILNITVPSVMPTGYNIPLTFIKNGTLCTLIINAFQTTYNGVGISFDMTDPSISQFLPSSNIDTILSTIIINNGTKQFGTMLWNELDSMNLTITTAGTVFNLDDSQSINYITA